MQRRYLIKQGLSAALATSPLLQGAYGQAERALHPAPTPRLPESFTHSLAKARVVVVGGGYAGATASKYLSLLSNRQIQVTLIEPDAQFISCPLSNLVIGGSKQMSAVFFRLGARGRRRSNSERS